MPLSSYIATLKQAKQSATAQNNYTTAKSILNPADRLSLAAGWFDFVGQRIRVRAAGAISHIVTTPGTITFQLMMGSIVAWTTGAIQLTTTAGTLLPWILDVSLRIDTVGDSTVAKFMGIGTLQGKSFTTGSGADPTVTDTTIVVPVTSPAVGNGFDSSAAQTFDLWAGWSIANSGNSVRVDDFALVDG